MADESSGVPVTLPLKSSPDAGHLPAQGQGPLGWAVRLTGSLLMLGSVICLGVSACDPLMGQFRVADLPYILVISLGKLGLCILALRIGFRMLLLVDASTIRQFSFIFALAYTYVLVHIMPLSGFFQGYIAFAVLLVVLYVGLSYWVLNRILSHLLLPLAKS